MNRVRVIDLEVGQRIEVNKTTAYVVGRRSDAVILSKQPEGAYVFSMRFYTHHEADLHTRVNLADPNKIYL